MLCNYMDFEGDVIVRWGLDVLVNGLFSLRFILAELVRYEEIQQELNATKAKMSKEQAGKLGVSNFAM